VDRTCARENYPVPDLYACRRDHAGPQQHDIDRVGRGLRLCAHGAADARRVARLSGHIVAVGLGLGEVLRRAPWLHDAVRIGGALFLLYFAWRIARAAGPQETEARRPFTLVEAALFQWLNPKSWTFAVGTIAAFTTPGLPFASFLAETGTIAIISGVLAFVSLSVWCLFGVMIGRLLADERKRRIFQYTLAVLLALSIVFLFV
jgi:threonine/homoserine/homoserine lactone efflux protein